MKKNELIINFTNVLSLFHLLLDKRRPCISDFIIFNNLMVPEEKLSKDIFLAMN